MSNRLADEKSPYLLQHANNPVDWYPWGEEAFDKAKSEDKPVFLSIGYSTCHWCHVMERESFEDEEVAAALGGDYVAIKVDREERPDIDHIYMAVCQALTGHGGWPLTVIMTPDKKPFFAGTYFPKLSKWGRPGLLEILEQISRKWKTGREEIAGIGERITGAVAGQYSGGGGEPEMEMVERAYRELEKTFDNRWGGFGSAPKFPTPHNLMFLLRYWKRTGRQKALQMVEKTLRSMYAGGIYDHIGFGFSRYSTDEKWLVPHFEKMLYDNALLSLVYTEAYQSTGNSFYREVAGGIYKYVLRDMTSPEGGFYSAEDADSEGVEGKFYVWGPREIARVLGQEEGHYFCQIYDITGEGNFEGRSIPNLIASGGLDGKDHKRIEASRQKLFDYREERVHPYLDDKVLTSWNGLMVSSLARSAAATGSREHLGAAERAVEFIWDTLRRGDGRLLARYRDGEAAIPGYIDDYAFLQWGLLELYEVTFKPLYLKRALLLLDHMTELFWDGQNGGFFFYGKDSENLITRPREVYDGAVPSGNSVAALNILRLARITGRDDLSDMAARQLSAFSGVVSQYPRAHAFFISAVQTALTPPREIVIAGKEGSEGVRRMVEAVHREFLPDAVVAFRPENGEAEEIEDLAPFTRGRRPVNGLPAAYICENFSCHEPTTDVDRMISLLKG
ncbi:MAG: thioredoxin [Peptococcaceae bacterium BICA1-7]|nr:MAG: thioredoxin [Peptococcaceae bacterium BICA1-7]HBV97081.1 thioredoxin domain-containing protein [Desulfotomaculum sp.]